MTTQYRYGYPKYRVFIFGVEISADVIGINQDFHDGATPNTCQLTILNDDDKYVTTTDDIAILNNVKEIKIPWVNRNIDKPFIDITAQGKIDEMGTKSFENAVNSAIRNPIKQQILIKKSRVVQDYALDNRRDPTGNQLTTNFTRHYGKNIQKYPLSDGSPVFHAMDPVRVFMRDPFDPSKWYHHFCGFISDMSQSLDKNNTNILTIVVEDPTKLFRYTRVFVNPGIIDAKKTIQEEDLKIRSFYASAFRDYDLAELFFTLIFGPDKVGAERFLQDSNGPAADHATSIRTRGIGNFSFDMSNIFLFGPRGEFSDEMLTAQQNSRANGKVKVQTHLREKKTEIELQDLSQWQALVDHMVQPSDMWVMALDEDRNSRPDIVLSRVSADRNDNLGPDGLLDVTKIIDYIGTHPEEYLVDGGKLMMLLPNSLGSSNRDVLTRDIINSYPTTSEWNSAGEILYDAINRIQFSLYCSPRGDIVVEFPMYDLDPDQFGMEKTTYSMFDVQSAAAKELSIIDAGVTLSTYLNAANSMTPLTNSKLSLSDPTVTATQAASAARPAALSASRLAKIHDRPRGPFGPNFVVTEHDLESFESGIIDEKVYTVAIMSKTIFQDWDSLGTTAIIGDMAVVQVPELIPIYGIRQVPITTPGYIASDEGVILYSNIMLNRLNADAHTVHVGIIPNLTMWVNRPIYIAKRNILTTVRKVGHSITWGAEGDMGTTLDLYATRSWSGQVDDNNKPIYSQIGGNARPLDYSVLFKRRPVSTNKEQSSGEVNINGIRRTGVNPFTTGK